MSIFVSVLGQKIYASSALDSIADGSLEFVKFTFNLSDDWDGLTVLAQFTQGGKSHNRYLDSTNSVCLPSEIGVGTCTLMLYGRTDSNSIIGTTNRLSFRVNSSGYISDATTSDISTAAYERLLESILNSFDFSETVNSAVATEIKEYYDTGKLTSMVIADNSVTTAKIAAGAVTSAKLAGSSVTTAKIAGGAVTGTKLADSSVTTAKISNSSVTSAKIADGSITSAKIADGTITSSDLATGLVDSLNLANSAMQPSVYDNSGHKTDIFAYAEEQVNSAKNTLNTSISAVSNEVVDARTAGGTTYSTLGNAVRGIYSAATEYTDTKLSEYESFTIEIVDALPIVGAAQTFYLMPKEVGTGYDKYWYITDSSGEGMWDVFGGSSTLIVDTLPDVGEPDVDYILKTASGYLYYKYIDEGWHVVAGSLAYISNTLPDVSEGSEFTDYYIGDENGSYSHYRFIDGSFRLVGANSYTKDELDETLSDLVAKTEFDEAVSARYTMDQVDELIVSLQNTIDTNSTNITTNTTTISSLSQALTNLQQEVKSIDTEGYTYYATYGTATLMTGEEAENVFTLWECKDNEETIKSQFVITGGSGSGTTASTNLVVERVTQSPIVVTTSDKVEISINFSSTDGDGETVDGTYTWKMGTTVLMTGSLIQGINTFDMTDYVTTGTQKLTLTVVDDGGSVSVKSWTVQVVDVRIESSFSDKITYPAGNTVNFTYTPYGAVSKTVHFRLDGQDLDPVVTTASGITQSYTLPAQEHGAHLLECWITATVNGMDVTTDHIYKDIIWYDETSNVPVIGCIYRNDYYGEVVASQYNSTSIPYYVYDPTSVTPTVTRSEDGMVTTTISMSGTSDIWAYKTDIAEVHTLIIACGETSVTIVMNIQELNIDISPVTGGLAFDFNPNGYSNASEDRLWVDGNTGVTMTVSDDFDWQNGGYQLDCDGNQYFCVKAGSTATINYNLFERDASLYGSEFKVIFKVTNVRNVDATFLSCVADSTQAGFRMDAHAAYLMTSATGDDPLYIPYSEDDIIELEFNINALDTDNADATAVIMSYEDGVGFRPLIYDSNHLLFQTTPMPILIGSEDCDIHIYRMKAYTSALTDSDILSNFIADSRDADTMLSRYYRNQIYDENNTLTPESLAEACPDLKIIKIDCPYFTQDKNEMIKNTTVQCIHKNGDPILDNWTAVNCYHSGQGTTSNEYGYAGRNLNIYMCFDGTYTHKRVEYDPDYITELTFGDGTKYSDGTGKVALTRTSVPNNIYNIKVNIASSENANNALLAKRFHDFLPYTPVSKRRDPNAKTTMEFANCVVFVRENSADLSTHREFMDDNKSYHFYAIGNIGDSKDTDNTRAYDPDDHNEFVVEIADNTFPNSTFPTGVYDDNGKMIYPIDKEQWAAGNTAYDSLYGSWDSTYEFRYDHPDVTDEEEDANIRVWNNFYEWVITSTDDEFINELDRWVIKEAALYMYLFTERYTMIDNRAKNTFWHYAKTYISQEEAEAMGATLAARYTIDDEAAAIRNGYRFDFWGYDHDTSLGINNSGEMTMPYGKEDTDYRTDGDPSSGYIYNAAESVFFCRIRDLMYNELQALYLSRETANAWSASGLISQFDTWQDMFPEELWRLDIERKYYRTYQGGTPRFLQSMMNGRKKYHRRQWERDQEAYMGTKYVSASIKADQIMFRCNTPQNAVVAPNYDLRIVPYSDMYIAVLYGNQASPVRIRAKAGTEYTIQCPWDTSLGEMSDTAILVYCASRIQELNDLSGSYIHDNDFSKASKLQRLIIGNATEGYANNFLTELNIGNNPLLTELNVQNCPKLVGAINLSGCGNLEVLDARGTAITGVTFATNGKIVSAYLPETINSITMKNLNYLTDLQATYDNLMSLTEEDSIVDEYAIVSDAADTLQILRLININWVIPDTALLNQILKMYSSVLTGRVYISGQVRQRELLSYAEAWPDLTVTYDPTQLVTQHLVTYVNADENGTVLYETYVDRGSTLLPDPYAEGLIEIPTLESTAQYHYSFGTTTDGVYDVGSGWDGLTSTLLGDRTVTAQYTATIRTYTVTWYSLMGLPLESVVAEYGADVAYPMSTPTYPSEGEATMYNVFSGWDRSTGFIREDTDVYAIWERASLPSPGTDISNMSVGEIFAVTTAGVASDYFSMKDAVDIELGHDFSFTNVDSELIAENLYLDGSTVIDKQITLFGENDPSFTLAIDFQFTKASLNTTLFSCYAPIGYEGFRLRYSNGPSIQWGDQNLGFGSGTLRDIVVLRHRKGDNKLYVYASNGTGSNTAFSTSIFYEAITRTASTTTESIITLGGVRYQEDGGYDDYGTGHIHWCKVWYDDLGDTAARQLASWYHEPIRMEYCGSNIYNVTDGASKKANASFVCNHLLAGRGQCMESSSSNEGGWDSSLMRDFCNSRVFAALPTVWQSMIKRVNIMASAGNQSETIITSSDRIYLLSLTEATKNATEPYILEIPNEQAKLEIFTDGPSRAKFRGIVIPDGATEEIFTGSTDPSASSANSVKEGSLWKNTGNGSTMYIYVTQDYLDKNNITPAYTASIGGGWVQASYWWLRSPVSTSSTHFWYIYISGMSMQYTAPGTELGICPCFSI